MRRRTILIAPLVALICAAGFAVALLSFPAVASAWSPTSLPPGWTIEHDTGGLDPNCQDAYRIWTEGRAAFSNALCTASPSYQADFDAWVDAHYTAPPPPPPTTTASTTSTTSPAVTTTVPATTTVTTTTTTTVPAPDPAPPTTTTPTPATTTPTVTAPTLTPVEQSLQDQLDTLTAAIAAVTDRLARLEQAGDAAWLAYQQSVARGDGPATAAGVARGTFLNVIYGLGAFKPQP